MLKHIMSLNMIPLCCTCLLVLIGNSEGFKTADLKDETEVSVPILLVVGCISILVLVLVLTLCGGCTPMEVGSDQHEAAGGRHQYSESTNYTSGHANVNSRVLSSGTNVASDLYQPEDHSNLPYPVRPQTDNNFTGYSTQPAGYQPLYQQQHSYQQQQSYQQQGYQQPGNQQQATHQPQPGYQQQTSIPGANRHPMDMGESPPPSYNEALGSHGTQTNSASAPAYGW